MAARLELGDYHSVSWALGVREPLHLLWQEKSPKTSGPFSHFVGRSTLLAAADHGGNAQARAPPARPTPPPNQAPSKAPP
jgi:hypothetical protein